MQRKCPYYIFVFIFIDNLTFFNGIGLVRCSKVIDESYLAGKVVEVNFTTARILLLSDLNSKIPVTIEPIGLQSILSGTGKNDGKIQYLKEEYKIENESTVYTSGSGGIFKAGIPIGKIKNIPGEEIEVDFFSDFTQLKFVKIVSYKKEEN